MQPVPYPLQQPHGIACPYCQYQGAPLVRKELSVAGWVFFIALLFFCFPLAWLPFVMDGCKDIMLNCPSCGNRLG